MKNFQLGFFKKVHQRVPGGGLYIGKIKIISFSALNRMEMAKNVENVTFESIFEITRLGRSVPDACKDFQIFEFSSICSIF